MSDTTSNRLRGQALVIVNEDFSNERLKRPGAVHDLRKTTALFQALDFHVMPYKNLTAALMLEKIKVAVEKDDRNEISECFTLVISSHGEELEETEISNTRGCLQQYILGTDGEQLMLDKIWKLFRKSTTLKNIPKLVLIQSCRSRSSKPDDCYDEGLKVDVTIAEERIGTSQTSDAWTYTDHKLRDLVEQLKNTCSQLYADWNDDGDCWQDTGTDTQQEASSETERVPEQPASEAASGSQTSGPNQEPEQTSTTNIDIAHEPPRPGRCFELYARTNRPTLVPAVPEPTVQGQQAMGGGKSQPPAQPTIVENCLVVFSSTSGRVSYHGRIIGSLLFHFMYKMDNVKFLLREGHILKYLTFVAHDVAAVDNPFGGRHFKACICLQHNLSEKLCFIEKGDNSLMAKIKQELCR